MQKSKKILTGLGRCLSPLLFSFYTLTASHMVYATAPEQTQQSVVASWEDADRSFVVQFASFTGKLNQMVNGVDKNDCDSIDRMYNLITDAAWITPQKEDAQIWNHLHQKAYALWKSNHNAASVWDMLDTQLKQYPQKTITNLANAYSEIISTHTKDFTLASENGVSVELQAALDSLWSSKKLRDDYHSRFTVLQEEKNVLVSETYPSLQIDRLVLGKEFKTYLTLIMDHYTRTGSIGDAIKSLDLPKPLESFFSTFLSKQVTTVTDQVIKSGVRATTGKQRKITPNSLEYVDSMLKQGKLISLETITPGSELSLGEPILKHRYSIESYLTKWKFQEFIILKESSKSLVSTAINGFAKPGLVQPTLRFMKLDDTMQDKPQSPTVGAKFAEAMVTGFAKKIVKDSVSFAIDGVEYLMIPKSPEKKPVGITLKNGIYFHVYSTKSDDQTDPLAPDLEKLIRISAEDIATNQLTVGPMVNPKTSKALEVMSKVGFWMANTTLDVVSDLSVKLAFDSFLKGMDHLTGMTLYANDHLWSDDTQYLGEKVALHTGNRLFKSVTKLALSKISQVFFPKKDVYGLTEIEGKWHYVYR